MLRRRFLQASLAAGGLSVPPWVSSLSAAPSRDFQVAKIERVTVRLPYRDTPGRHMARELPHWEYSEICKVHLQSGHVGYGETLLYYTWGATQDEHVRQVQGGDALRWMWNDKLGAGLQMALFDAVAKTAGVPIHRLLGNQVHDKTPLSWWNIDTSAEDMAAECREAHRQGYMAYKTKGRPWFDVREQVRQAAAVVPENFQIDMDFNDTLLDAKRGIPILKDLAACPQVSIYESPIFQNDIAGNQAIRKATRVPVAMHYGNPAPKLAIKHEICDGFVVGGGATKVMQTGAVAAMADLPFWLQLVGTGITAAWSLHFGAVLSHATWPAVNCHQLYRHHLLKKPIRVQEGFAEVPQGPGLGYEIDWDVVEKHRVDKPAARPDPPRLIETVWPNGDRMDYANTGAVNFVLNPARQGKVPFYRPGAVTRLVPNDGSQAWKERRRKAIREPKFYPA